MPALHEVKPLGLQACQHACRSVSVCTGAAKTRLAAIIPCYPISNTIRRPSPTQGNLGGGEGARRRHRRRRHLIHVQKNPVDPRDSYPGNVRRPPARAVCVRSCLKQTSAPLGIGIEMLPGERGSMVDRNFNHDENFVAQVLLSDMPGFMVQHRQGVFITG